jgi:hypothetical protein
LKRESALNAGGGQEQALVGLTKGDGPTGFGGFPEAYAKDLKNISPMIA